MSTKVWFELDEKGNAIIYTYSLVTHFKKVINAMISHLLFKQPPADFIIRGETMDEIWAFFHAGAQVRTEQRVDKEKISRPDKTTVADPTLVSSVGTMITNPWHHQTL